MLLVNIVLLFIIIIFIYYCSGKSWPDGQRVGLVIRKVASSSLGPARIVVGGGNVQERASTFNTTTEVPLSKAPNPHLLPGGYVSIYINLYK